MSTSTITDASVETHGESNRLTEVLKERLNHPATSPDFDLNKSVSEVLADVGMTSDDCGGGLSFYGRDPSLQSPVRFGTMAAIGMAARSVAVAALWRQATGEGQKISMDGRKAVGRFCCFFVGQRGNRQRPAAHARRLCSQPIPKGWGCVLSQDTRRTIRGGAGYLSSTP